MNRRNSWQEYIIENTISAINAAALVKDGNRVLLSHAASEPAAFIRALIKNCKHLNDVELVQMLSNNDGSLFTPEVRRHLRYNSLFVSKSSRSAVNCGIADFTPVHFSKIPELFYSNILPVDIFVFQAAPPDDEGYVSLGTNVDYAIAGIRRAQLVIAEINSRMPFTLGEARIHVSEIDKFVFADEELQELAPSILTEAEIEIGRNCAALINDGDTLQMGIGSLPDAVAASLSDKNDLGVHTEMFADGTVELMKSGVINNSRKTLHPGVSVASFLMGTRALFDFVDKNSSIYMAPVDYVNDPYVIAKNDNMVSVNTCVEIDLFGQVCAESFGTRQISATGGQVDFIRGASMSCGGRSIIALTSTSKNGSSKIVARLESGAAVTSLRNDVDFIVTEYGTARLKGLTLRERSRKLISLAAPAQRDLLKKEYKSLYHELWSE